MQVLKFGGSSLLNAQRFFNVSRIVIERSALSRVGLVLSAVGGITDILVNCIHGAIKNDNILKLMTPYRQKHEEIINEINQYQLVDSESLLSLLDKRCEELELLLRGIQLIKECPYSVHAQILSLGERMSVAIMDTLLVSQGADIELLDSCEYIKTKGLFTEGLPIIEEIEERFSKYRNQSPRILLMAGFIASNLEGRLTLLGRNGSDFSAALMAVGLKAELCEIWTDVDGIYSADPRLVADAKLISEMSFGEAMEISFYGAKVLHPKTISPLALNQIPIKIRNTLNPSAPGSMIHKITKDQGEAVRAISCLEHVVLFNIYGPGLKGSSGIAARVFTAISKRNISIILITQSSSEYSICFCIAEHDVRLAEEILKEEFHFELKEKLIEKIEVLRHQAIICIVSDQMKSRRGVAGKFFSALAAADININAISQGSSERSISAVINGNESTLALNAAHRFFFKTTRSIDVYLVGPGSVGSYLLEEIKHRQKELLNHNIDIHVRGITNSKKMVLSHQEIDLNSWQELLDRSNQSSDISLFMENVKKGKLLNPVLVDCTTSKDVAELYPQIFKSRMHIVAANKKANTLTQSYYQKLRDTAKKHSRRFLYETNVGAGLPIIDTLQNLLKTGDQLIQFSGISSGSLSFIFGLLEEDIPFSKAIQIACDKNFTEPDPRDDLSGLDVARKLLIIYRETGEKMELSDIMINSIFPESFDTRGSVPEFLKNIKKLDDYFSDRVKQLRKKNLVMRFVGEIDQDKCHVGIKEVGPEHPLYTIKGGENAFVFLTQYYSPIPLVIRGYGAGTAVTAAGVFADILKTIY